MSGAGDAARRRADGDPYGFSWLEEHARTAPSAPAIGTPEGWVDFLGLAERTRRLAEALHEGGLRAGDFLVLALPNTPVTVAASLAAQALGACAVELNRELGTAAFGAVLRQTGARHGILLGRDLKLWAPLLGKGALERLWLVHPSEPPPALCQLLETVSWERWLESGLPAKLDDAHRGDAPASSHPGTTASAGQRLTDWRRHRAEAPALLVYTSGSTGSPRGVVQTHRNLAANTAAICDYLELTPADRVLSILPLSYAYGKSLLQTHLCAGASVFFEPRFVYPRVAMESIGRERCTGFAGVPLTFELLRRQLDLGALELSSLRYVTQAGGAMRAETIDWARRTFAPARLFVMYGQTEATARLSFLPPERAADKAGSIGRGLSNVELRVVDDAGAPVEAGTVGQLVARGPSVSPGYFADPAGTAEILRDGWLWTGDLARQDAEGFVTIVGRASELLKLSGFRVAATELEHALTELPEVRDAGIVGAADALGGELAVAFVVPARAGLTADEVKRALRARAPAYKVPRVILFVDSLPRTSSGKLARAELRERLAQEPARGALAALAEAGAGEERDEETRPRGA